MGHHAEKNELQFPRKLTYEGKKKRIKGRRWGKNPIQTRIREISNRLGEKKSRSDKRVVRHT